MLSKFVLLSILFIFLLNTQEALRFGNTASYYLKKRCQRRNLIRLRSIVVDEAEKGFVDAYENLEDGERCLVALKAWEDSSRNYFLGAGALVEVSNNEVTLWLGESDERGVGLNAQVLALVRLGLELMAFGLDSYEKISAEVSGPGSRLAASRLGFEYSNENELLFEDKVKGPAALTALAVDNLDFRSAAVHALRSLSRRQKWYLKVSQENDTRATLSQTHYYLSRAFLSLEESLFFKSISLDFDTAHLDSVDGISSHHCLLLEDGKYLVPQTESSVSKIIPRVEAIIHSSALCSTTKSIKVRDVFLREYFAANDASFINQQRSSLAPHFDTWADATLVIDLAPLEHDGGLYIQTHTHPSTRRLIPFSANGTDAFIHDNSILHGVARLSRGKRRSLIFWLSAKQSSFENQSNVLLNYNDMHRAYCCAANMENNQNDDYSAADAQSIYAALAERGHSLSACRLGSIREGHGDLVGACAAWILAARDGNTLAQEALADVLSNVAENEDMKDLQSRVTLAPGDNFRQLAKLWAKLASHRDVSALI